MPRRNRRRRRNKRRTETPDDRHLPTSYEGMARDLVERGLASPQVLGAGSRPPEQKEPS